MSAPTGWALPHKELPTSAPLVFQQRTSRARRPRYTHGKQQGTARDAPALADDCRCALGQHWGLVSRAAGHPHILIPMPRCVRSPVLRISDIQTALNTSSHSHTRDSMQEGHRHFNMPACPPLCSTIHAGSHSLTWSQSPRLFAFTPSLDCLVAFTPPSSAAATSALLHDSCYRQWQLPARGQGRCSP